MLLKRTLLVNGIATAMTGVLALVGAPWLPAVLGPTSGSHLGAICPISSTRQAIEPP